MLLGVFVDQRFSTFENSCTDVLPDLLKILYLQVHGWKKKYCDIYENQEKNSQKLILFIHAIGIKYYNTQSKMLYKCNKYFICLF